MSFALTGGPWATGIGSLPFTDEDAARALLERFAGEVPFEPELPLLDPDEALLRKPFAGLLEPGSIGEAALAVSVEDARRAPPQRLGRGLALLEELARAARPRFVKVQLAGPRVLGTFATDRAGKAFGSSIAAGTSTFPRERVGDLAHAAAHLLAPFRVVFFLDEPGFAGDATDVSHVLEVARKAGAVAAGVHDCGDGFRAALASRPDVLSFDFATYGKTISGERDPLATFVCSGGSLAWGVVPTLPGAAKGFDPELAASKVREAALSLMGNETGAHALLDRSLVTPACGTALLSPEEAIAIHEHAIEVARLLREK